MEYNLASNAPPSLDPREIAKRTEHGYILKLKRDGYSNEHIARTLRIHPMRVNAVIAEALKALQGDSTAWAKEIREVELQRLDIATRALMPRVERGDLGAINYLLKVQIRRANYLGLDSQVSAPSNINVTISWASPDRLSYQREIVEAAEPQPVGIIETEPQPVEWKDISPDDKAMSEARKLDKD